MISTSSYCDKCKKSIPAQYIFKDGKTYFKRICKEHEHVLTDMNIDQSVFEKWMDSMEKKVINIPPKISLTKGSEVENSQCPLHCGTCENHLQTACCVVIDITKRCNQHCPYCFASAENDDSNDLTIEEIEKKLNFLAEVGETTPFNLQLSGGEPTVREDLPQIIKLAKEKGFNFVQVNTNGKRIGQEKEYAEKLKEAGASVVFLQFDGTDDEIYWKLRGESLLEIKKKAIENLRRAKLSTTLVPTVVPGVNEKQIKKILDFGLENIDIVKAIHFQPVSYFGRHPEDKKRGSMFNVINELEKAGYSIKKEDFLPITSGHPLCCFYSIFLKDGDKLVSQIKEEDQKKGLSCCEIDPEEIIKKDRGFVINKWDVVGAEGDSLDQKNKGGEELSDEVISRSQDIETMDQFIQFYRRNTITITAMPFQDIETLDSERLKRCRVQVLSKENKLIPFCAYNSIYREAEKE